ncbi:MAG: stage III sporulation protein AA, partial [Oscillospiraceae bacterium]|nr:stage III sporulation protein AA [Oscillospiraceae bacterium]
MTEEYAASRFEEACALLPGRLRAAAMELDKVRKAEAEELRLRIARPLYVTLPQGEAVLPRTMVTRSDLEQVLDKASEYSRYAAAETIRHGYVTAAGGFRVGLCGTALPGGERNEGVRDVSSLAIRIPRTREGAALPILPELLEDGRPVSALLLSPPGGGKPTLLRDLVRLFSQGTERNPPCRVALVDER